MMDQFHEEVVSRHNKGLQNFTFILANITFVILGLFAFIELNLLLTIIPQEGFSTSMILDIAIIVVFGAIAVVLFLKKDQVKTEYEYTFTNGAMDFAQVYNNKKRKALGTMNVRNVEAFGKVASGSFNRYINMPNVKRTNWFLNRDAELYYFYFVKDSNKRIIIIEPSEEMVDLIKKNIGQGVLQNN